MDAAGRAEQLIDACLAEGQAVRRVPEATEAEQLRAELRRVARQQGLRIRTARLDDTVVVARTDAELWTDDTATMRRKLAPPPG